MLLYCSSDIDAIVTSNKMYITFNLLSSLYMGCFGIGVTRLLAASLEVLSTPDQLRWCPLLAPFQVCIIPQKVCSNCSCWSITPADGTLAFNLHDQLQFLASIVLACELCLNPLGGLQIWYDEQDGRDAVWPTVRHDQSLLGGHHRRPTSPFYRTAYPTGYLRRLPIYCRSGKEGMNTDCQLLFYIFLSVKILFIIFLTLILV